jgi:hypothetical protein
VLKGVVEKLDRSRRVAEVRGNSRAIERNSALQPASGDSAGRSCDPALGALQLIVPLTPFGGEQNSVVDGLLSYQSLKRSTDRAENDHVLDHRNPSAKLQS